MLIWRISNFAGLDGTGGMLADGRWHSRGRPVLYAADHPGSALLEILVNVRAENLPVHFRLLGIDTPEPEPASTLPEGWTSAPALSRAAGDRWLASGSSVALRVPSAIVPHAWNVLINPQHPDIARVKIVSDESVPLDARLRPALSP